MALALLLRGVLLEHAGPHQALVALGPRHQGQDHHLRPRGEQQGQGASGEDGEAQGGPQADEVVLALEGVGEVVGLLHASPQVVMRTLPPFDSSRIFSSTVVSSSRKRAVRFRSSVRCSGQVDLHLVHDAAGAGGEDVDLVREVHRLRDVVGHEEDGALDLLPQLVDEVLHPEAGLHVEGAEGLVHEDDLGLHGQGAGDGHALAHAAGELVRVLLLRAREPDLLDPGPRHRLALVPGHAAQHEPEGHVLEHGEPGVRAVALEDHAPVGPGPRDGLPAQQGLAGGGREEAGHDVQDRALAAARGPQEHAELAAAGLVRDLEVHVPDGVELLAVGVHEGLADVPELEDVAVVGSHQDLREVRAAITTSR